MSWTRKLLPQSLRARLIVSFGVLIFLSLFLAGTTTVYLLREEQERTARERVGRLAEPIALRAAVLEAAGATPDQIQDFLQQEYEDSDVRILLIDSNATVVSDTGGTLRGTTVSGVSELAPPSGPPSGPPGGTSGGAGHQPRKDSRFEFHRWSQNGEALVLFSAPPVRIDLPGPDFVPTYRAVIAIEQSDISQAWRDLLPRLFLAGGAALFAGVIAASLLARSIARPLREMTTASEEMAKGRYDQRIPVYGNDEMGRLGSAFNNMARQVNRSHRTLRDFLANVSHELKTPLTSIQGFSQAMTDGTLQRPEDYAEAGRIVNEEAIRMRGLVDDLLYLSQVEAGENVMHFERLQPRELLGATVERFGRRAGQMGVQLFVQSGQTPEIDADPRRLEQALANIVDNAVRHTPAGGRVTLRSATNDGHVQLAVHNTGSVIPPEALPRLFDRFFQVDPARSRNSDGNTGLGLAITKEIVEAHGGQVEVTSTAATGTEFVISLPLRAATASEERDGSETGDAT